MPNLFLIGGIVAVVIVFIIIISVIVFAVYKSKSTDPVPPPPVETEIVPVTMDGGAGIGADDTGEPVETAPPPVDVMTRFEVVKGKAMSGHNDQKFTDISVKECAEKCVANTSCKSFDYEPNAKHPICYISNSNRMTQGASLRTYPGDYYELIA